MNDFTAVFLASMVVLLAILILFGFLLKKAMDIEKRLKL